MCVQKPLVSRKKYCPICYKAIKKNSYHQMNSIIHIFFILIEILKNMLPFMARCHMVLLFSGCGGSKSSGIPSLPKAPNRWPGWSYFLPVIVHIYLFLGGVFLAEDQRPKKYWQGANYNPGGRSKSEDNLPRFTWLAKPNADALPWCWKKVTQS